MMTSRYGPWEGRIGVVCLIDYVRVLWLMHADADGYWPGQPPGEEEVGDFIGM